MNKRTVNVPYDTKKKLSVWFMGMIAIAAMMGTAWADTGNGDEIPILKIISYIIFVTAAFFFVAGLRLIRDDEVGIKTKKMFGEKMPQGQIIARNGEIGIQADTLMPGLYWFNPLTWSIDKAPIVSIDPNQVGVIESIDGEPITTGRLLGDPVECNSYQNAKAFLDNGGKKGPQVEILRPGQYRINLKAFKVLTKEVTTIDEEMIGVVTALDGVPMPPGYMIAPEPTDGKHNFFQDGQAFINSNGHRGPQLATLQPGNYYINPLLFEVVEYDIAEVPPGYVAVLRSNIGKELVKDDTKPPAKDKPQSYEQSVHEKDEVVLTTDKNQRGIWREPIAPGKYNMNPLAFTAYPVPTSAVTIDWAAGTDIRTDHITLTPGDKKKPNRDAIQEQERVDTDKATEFFKFSQLRVTSKDGFQLEVDVRLIIRIRPQFASFVIARFGSVANLIQQIVHPLIDSSFRNNAGEKKAIDFIQDRTELQREALERATSEFEKYHVEAQNLLIAYIAVDKALLDTQTKKEIAFQQQEQFQAEAKAQEDNIVFQEKSARALKQRDVIDAKLSIEIEEDRADALRKKAEGVRDSTKVEADGIAYKERETGKGIADAYEAQAKAIGPERIAMLKALKEIADGKIRITPDFLVVGGDGKGEGVLLNTWLATMLADRTKKEQTTEEK